MKTALLPGPRAGKTVCHLPRGCHRGVLFLNSIHPEQPETRLHWYRRNLLGECFVAFFSFFDTFLPLATCPPGGKNVRSESTRLNSSHQIISYAVFCLKKKNSLSNTDCPCPTSLASKAYRQTYVYHPL